MATIKAHTLSGFMELLPAPQTQMERLMEVLRSSYGVYGFTPLDTPIIEASDVLLAKGGGETEKQIYRFSKGDSDLSLRFDLTVPLAKYVALHYADLAFPFRRFQIGKVYRGERAQRGRFREFYQADIDVIGDGRLDIMNDAEVPAVIARAFTELGLTDFTIRINNRKVLGGYFELVGITDKLTEALRTVDKLEKIGAENVHELLMSECGLDSASADRVLEFGVSSATVELAASRSPAVTRRSSPSWTRAPPRTRAWPRARRSCARSSKPCPAWAWRRRTSPSTSPSRAAWTTTPARCTRRS